MDLRLLAHALWLRRRLRHREHWSRPRLERHQAQALQRLRAHAYARSPFYRRLHAGRMTAPLHELPVLTKALLMAHFDELVTDPDVRLADLEAHVEGAGAERRFRNRYWVALTSGTTGRRGVFLADPKEWATVLASYARANDWAGLGPRLLHPLRMAVVSSTVPWHQSARVGASVQSPLVHALRLDSTRPMPELVARLEAHRPESLVAYASMARALAEEQLAGRLHLAPRAVMCASEVLTPEGRERIEQAWGVRPFDVYAATETAGVASECERHAGLHLYEDLVITEVVDAQNRPVPPGVYGAKVLVTVLFSRTQPLIRYEMSDSVCLGAALCACGRPFRLLSGVQGRSEDVLSLPGAGGAPVAVPPNLFHQLLEPLPLHGWQVVQEEDGLRLLLAGAAPAVDGSRLAEALRRALAERGVTGTPVRVERVADIPKTSNGKARLIVARHTR